MEQRKRNGFRIVLWVALAGLLVGVILLAPKALDAYGVLQRETNATPTPTANTASVLQVTIDPANTPTPTALLLKIGSAGDEVTRMQTRLKELGYYAGEIDGQFGQASADAVKLFQDQHNLIADGVAGTDTLGVLYGGNAETYIPTPTPSATPSKLAKGDKGGAVESLQQRLKELGYYVGSIDGDFGGATQEAVRLFQQQSGLTVDGVCAEQTLGLLFSDAAKQVTVTPTPDPATMPVLVNKEHPVDSNYAPDNLVYLRNVLPSSLVTVKGSDIQGDRAAAAALQEMFEGAKIDGVTGWQISAGYRSYAYQKDLFDRQVAAYVAEGKSKADATSATKLTVAEPGASEHHTGLAFDITVSGTIFKGTEQQKWLAKNCWDYGFVIRYQEDKEKITGFIAECWHIRYVGIQHSVVMRDQNLCLEEYLAQ